MGKMFRMTMIFLLAVAFVLPSGGAFAHFEGETQIPQIDCSTARIPITEALYALLTEEYGLEGPEPMCSKTHGAWLNLANGSADIIFLIAPSQDEFDAFTAQGIDIEMKVYGFDGLVFLGNQGNPVQNLTAEQIRSIYRGKIKSWDKIPGGRESDMVVYIRNPESGSQRLFESLVWAGHEMPDFSSMKFKEGEVSPVVTQRTKQVEIFDEMETITRSVLINQYSLGFNIMSYIDTEFLQPSKAVDELVKATGEVRMRSGPGLDYEGVGTISKGRTLPYLGESSVDDRGVAWYLAEHETKGEVWISSRYSQIDGNDSGNLKLFSVNGYAPTTENFEAGLYPFLTTSYVAIRANEPEDSPTRKLFDWVGSDESRELIAKNSTLSVAFSDPVVLGTGKKNPATSEKLSETIELLSEEALTREALYAFTQEEIGYLRQGLFALSGKVFPEGKYREYFEGKPWYEAIGGSDAQVAAHFNACQAENMQLITQYQKELRRANANLDGQIGGMRDLFYEKGVPLMNGEDVLAVQLSLAAQGYMDEASCDGVFGRMSAEAVRAFQQDSRLAESGVADVDVRMLLGGG